ncbi:MAG: arginine--tRNA ligase [Candidatus Kerfeldbacteria bacterium RIFCSPHIGHO2_02_FULL_42_14]|uniref:Arginine--tRNA ligase n=1 Tax=Candidatus Kerfeldbacteria bacterium RIFCSPHIGHO2_02_FULL_42_14 TaxID=1798540 RepID=A0A1G2ANY2_9BACT|nr:MAG: arginine--tRNA ligase [Candidatus Kerfeldbacteria bacterium RIFCSPHIGHO2_02_FULL_42_14]OGY80807.1 MAG: arginine--tRNA ligase [Candidatus Kerfeldbacteria bacterium RIFCSPHIGHO2_12_FULL_42_13]OGY84978.1 MAG: arginine--tRNA ligase [Candidatus Kerfeldbacteria bacterium RIFCSPLOWO2_02_FULL_42_19]OGY86146.1 MAG: arginine--tRNA ligase [Candidatus Kerfeldbacteria bacterium RIFCSPLOWO2_12_FULL_43_9]
MKEIFSQFLEEAIEKLQKEKIWPVFALPVIELSYPTHKEHGDVSSNIALRLSKVLKMSPMHIGEQLARLLQKNTALQDVCDRVALIPPGFLNFHFNTAIVMQELGRILDAKKTFGSSKIGRGKRVTVEFISANPTGPLTLPNARGGFAGDTLANVLRMQGYAVKKEYYINDIGNQIDLLAESVVRRYLQSKGISVEYPEHLYQGEYIHDIARQLKLKITRAQLEQEDAIRKIAETIRDEVLTMSIHDIQRVIKEKMGIQYHYWFRESSLYTKINLKSFLQQLEKDGLVYKQDEAFWFATKKFGDDKDRVIVKMNGAQTYFLSDILYLRKRLIVDTYDRKILFLGADHHGYVKRFQAVAKAFGAAGKLDIVIMQMAKLLKDGKEVRMSKRKGTFVTIEEVIDEVGTDVARFFFLMYASDTHLDFNMNLAKEQSEKNPVYYVQYAFVRIASIERELKKRFARLKRSEIKTMTHEAEKELVKKLSELPEIMQEVSKSYELHLLPLYAISVAKAFHNFYTQCRVIEDTGVNVIRAYILQATKQVLRTVLETMGVTTPEKM